jgi:hypothetical protein
MCMLFHIKCPECGSLTVKATTAHAEFDEPIADINLLGGATPDT